MIYFDNAATGGFKPRAVTDAVENVIRYLNANPGRSGHRLSLTGANIVTSTREIFKNYVGANNERVIFTKNCTESLNTAIFGTLKPFKHVITTVYEHNSVLRPLYYLKTKGLIELDVVAPNGNKSLVKAIEEKINDKTYLIVLNAVSNVTGEILPVLEVEELAKKHNLLLILDMAQAGGHINFNIKDTSISAMCFAGHKGLYGIMGSGVLCINDNVNIEPLTFGGTGSESFSFNQPSCYPDRLESGTLNLPAIVSLFEGANYAFSNIKTFSKTLLSYSEIMIEELKSINNITVYSVPNPCGIIAFKIKDISSNEVADKLNYDYDIAVRSGLHCAPLYHEYLKTDKEGLIRASLSVQNTTREIYTFLRAIKEIVNN